MFAVEPFALNERSQRILARMSERGVTHIMGQANRLGQVLVEPQRPRHGPAHLRDVNRVSHSGDEVVAVRVEEHLGLVLQPSKCLAVSDSIPISLEDRPELIRLLVDRPAQ